MGVSVHNVGLSFTVGVNGIGVVLVDGRSSVEMLHTGVSGWIFSLELDERFRCEVVISDEEVCRSELLIKGDADGLIESIEFEWILGVFNWIGFSSLNMKILGSSTDGGGF